MIPSFGSFPSSLQLPFEREKVAEGVAAVEFAIILPILMLIIFGMIEYGYMFYVDMVITNAAREGARAGVTIEDKTNASSHAHDVTETYLTANLPGVAHLTEPPSTDESDPYITVVVSVDPFVPLINYPLIPLPPKLIASSSMLWEYSP
jgi:Flp pilus assembly protein TadG